MDVCDTNENMPGVLFQQQKHQLVNKYTKSILKNKDKDKFSLLDIQVPLYKKKNI